MYPDSDREMPVESNGQLPLSHQEKALVDLHDTISQLTVRLKAVLTPDIPSETATDSANHPNAPRSPLAEQISANNRGITEAARKIRFLMDRLEC